jgi:phenylpropionate dioxygenase-like ring-hydroxylating dioxygenase large terminal subunit
MDGSLMAIPQDQHFPDVDKSKFGLHQIQLETLHGLMFVRVKGDGPSLAEHFGNMDRYLEMYDVANYVQCAESTTQIWNCNWKVAWDNYLENYHIPIGHPGLNRLLCEMDEGEGLSSGVDYGIFELRSKPSNVEVERQYQKMSVHAQARIPEEIRNKWIQYGVAGSHGLDFYPEMLDVFQIIPLSYDRTLIRAAYYGHPDPTPEEQELRRLNMEINDSVNGEDKTLCERVQKGLQTSGYAPGPLSQLEVGIHFFHQMIRKLLPVATLDESPGRGHVATRNDEMRRSLF